MRRQPRRRRALSWFLNASVADNAAASGTLVNQELAFGLAGDERRGATVTRVRGEMVVWTALKTAASTQQAIWYAGIIVGHENLLTTIPDPELDDADWLWYRTGYLVHPTRADDAGTASLFDGIHRYIEVDNRSQRKMLSQESVVLFVFKNDASSDFTVQVGMAARVLIKHR